MDGVCVCVCVCVCELIKMNILKSKRIFQLYYYSFSDCIVHVIVRLTGREPLVFLPGPFANEPPNGKAHLKQCEQMTLTRRQKRLCRREPGLAETLRESVRLSLLECRYQFRNERWNCSMDGRGSLLKRGKICQVF